MWSIPAGRDKPEKVQAGWNMVKKNVGKVSDLVNGILYASKERTPEYQVYDRDSCSPRSVIFSTGGPSIKGSR